MESKWTQFLKGGKRPEKPSRQSSQKAHAPPGKPFLFTCNCKKHGSKDQKSREGIKWEDGSLRTVTWQPCRKQVARTFILDHRSPPGEGETGEAEEAAPQQAQPQPAEQPQEPQDEAAGPSSSQAPAGGAARPMAQQEAGPSGGNTVPGPFGRPVPAPGLSPPSTRHAMPFAPRSQYMEGYSGAQGMGYPQDAPFAGGYGGRGDPTYAGGYGGYQGMPRSGGHGGRYTMPATRTPGDMPFPEDVEGLLYPDEIGSRPLPGNLGDMPFPEDLDDMLYSEEIGDMDLPEDLEDMLSPEDLEDMLYGEEIGDMDLPENLEDMLSAEDLDDMPLPGGPGEGEEMPLPEGYDQGEGMPMAGMPAGGGVGMRAPSTVAAAAEARPGRVAVSHENLYHSGETDGVVKYKSFTALESAWGPVKYSKY